ncbi:NACHT domain-containing protein [Camillea tinctor]|nr:NACHT domain-containing protein [Camillea tinctor]
MSTAPVQKERRGVHLQQVYPEPGKNDTDTDIDIIAIHGLDTRSPDTWTWKDPKAPASQVNWLQDPRMLPNVVKGVRIFTCDWPADLFEQSNMVQKTIEEYSLLLFEGIQTDIQLTKSRKREKRPIFFIASCLGGIILIKALVDTGERYDSIRKATRGILFLATPFRGTSFQDIAGWAEPGLRIWARIQDRQASQLIDSVQGSTFDLENLVHKFTKLSQDRESSYLLFNFYEKETTILPPKVPSWLFGLFATEKLLVDRSSASLDIITDPLPLGRRHLLMNKFSDPECADYKLVAGRIQTMIREIREGTPLEQADAWIRKYCYTEDRLSIKRLSGHKLPMDLCYINLAIVEQIDGNNSSITFQSSPFALATRLNIGTPDEDAKVELSTMFEIRRLANGNFTSPRRILIRGRAGVGKTTLCKRIVHDFIQGTWEDKFDRILWIPLRRLKTWKPPTYNLKELFNYEFFSQYEDSDVFAKEMTAAVQRNEGETLFVLDGLDEIVSGLSTDGNLPRLLDTLLNQPNVIITSRPHANLPTSVRRPDLELETIGFYPDQVQEYIEKTCRFENPCCSEKATKIQSYIQDHTLIQDLVRIPIQLDAFCFTWDDKYRDEHTMQTLTDIYQAIETRLWKKDILRLRKKHGQELLTEDQIETMTMDDTVERGLAKDELLFLEYLAFTGLHNDIIDFDSKDMGTISNEFGRGLVLDKFLPHLSFLRTSDPTARQGRNYQFLHLTFQEYYAARYFARHFAPKKGFHTDLECLELSFFRAIEDEPRDLFGPAHQRLVMNCLSEVASSQGMPEFQKLRTYLEDQLRRWLLFECFPDGYYDFQPLSCEREFPESILEATLREAPEKVKIKILRMLQKKTSISKKTGDYSILRGLAINILGREPALPTNIVQSMIDTLEHQDGYLRGAAASALCRQSALPESVVDNVVNLLEWGDEPRSAFKKYIMAHLPRVAVRIGNILALQRSPTDMDVVFLIETAFGNEAPIEDVIENIPALLENQDRDARYYAVRILKEKRTALPEKVVQDIMALGKDRDDQIRAEVVGFMEHYMARSEVCQAVVSFLGDPSRFVRRFAACAIRSNWTFIPDTAHGNVMHSLGDEDQLVVEDVIKIGLEHRLALPETWRAVRASLENPGLSSWDIRQIMSSISQHLGSSPEDIYQRAVDWVNHLEEDVRCNVEYEIQHQPSLSESTLQNILTWLTDSRNIPGSTVADGLLKHIKLIPDERFSSFLLGLGSQSFNQLYRQCLGVSFRCHITWYVEGEFAYLDTPEGSKRFPFDQSLRRQIEEVQRSLMHPDAHTKTDSDSFKEKIFLRTITAQPEEELEMQR